jgi:hypothetical protein
MINQTAYQDSNLDYIELQLKHIHLLSETVSSWLDHFVIICVEIPRRVLFTEAKN